MTGSEEIAPRPGHLFIALTADKCLSNCLFLKSAALYNDQLFCGLFANLLALIDALRVDKLDQTQIHIVEEFHRLSQFIF